MKKKRSVIIVSILFSVVLLWFHLVRFDIAIKANNSFGLLIVAGLLSFIPYIIYGGWIIWLICFIVKNSESKLMYRVLPLAVNAITILLLTVIPYTDVYVNLNYSFNKDNFNKTIEMINDGEIQLPRTNTNEYIVPYRLTSYTGQLYTYENDDVIKIMFFAYSGIRGGVVLVYSSDDSEIKNTEFQRRFENVKKVDKNWYSARIRY